MTERQKHTRSSKNFRAAMSTLDHSKPSQKGDIWNVSKLEGIKRKSKRNRSDVEDEEKGTNENRRAKSVGQVHAPALTLKLKVTVDDRRDPVEFRGVRRGERTYRQLH